jgi:hypothetical protein
LRSRFLREPSPSLGGESARSRALNRDRPDDRHLLVGIVNRSLVIDSLVARSLRGERG